MGEVVDVITHSGQISKGSQISVIKPMKHLDSNSTGTQIKRQRNEKSHEDSILHKQKKQKNSGVIFDENMLYKDLIDGLTLSRNYTLLPEGYTLFSNRKTITKTVPTTNNSPDQQTLDEEQTKYFK